MPLRHRSFTRVVVVKLPLKHVSISDVHSPITTFPSTTQRMPSQLQSGCVGTSVGEVVVGASVVGAAVVGASVVGAAVVGASVIGAAVVGASVVGAAVVGASVRGTVVVGTTVGFPGSMTGSTILSHTLTRTWFPLRHKVLGAVCWGCDHI